MKRKILIIVALLLVAFAGLLAINELTVRAEAKKVDETINFRVKSELALAVKTNAKDMRESSIEEAQEQRRIELERIEAERRAAEIKKARENRIAANGALDAPGPKYIALTFDDGPGPHTGRLLDIMNSYGARGTFFVVGRNISSNPGAVSRIVSEGHEIGIHSWSHPQLTTLKNDEISSQIMDTRSKIMGVAGVDSVLVRPPYGSVNNTVKSVGQELGCSYINWSVDSLDWSSRNVEEIRCEILSSVKNGSIILCHDIHGTTVDAMDVIIPELQAKGFIFVTTTELLGATTPGVVYYHG